jgi:phosphate transport system permease protein
MDFQLREKADRLFGKMFRIAGLLVIAILAGIFLMLIYNSIAFFLHFKPVDFLTDTQWNPGKGGSAEYGILPLLASTCLVTAGAMIIAVPLGICTAAFLSEFAGRRIQQFLKPVIEMLAAIPSVAVGFLGIVIVGPGIARMFHIQSGLNALNGSVLLAIMSLPTIITIAEDAIHAVPSFYREGSYALGADKWATLIKITLPAARPGLIAAIMLGMGRAIGETMTVLMATGNVAAFPRGFLDSVKTITATIAIEIGEVPYQTTHYFALFAIAAILFIITLAVNLFGEAAINRVRKFHL